MEEKISVAGFGGNIVASIVDDPEYPGIRIDFEQDGLTTCLALVEQADKKLMLRSYMRADKDEPLSTPYIYDREILRKTAYTEAKRRSMDVTDYESFCARINRDDKEIFQFLPKNMWFNYLLAK